MTTVSQVIEKINIVVPEVRSISGTVSRDGLTEDEAAFTTGAVRYIDGVHLRPFVTARAAASRVCLRRGVRLLNGFGIPDEALDAVVSDLSDIDVSVSTARAIVTNNWSTLLANWQEQHPAVAAYAGRFPSASLAASRIGMTLAVYKVNPQPVKVEAGKRAIDDQITMEIGGLAGRVLEEIAQEVKTAWKPEATRATQRIKGLLGRVLDKLNTLTFLDGGKLGKVARFVEDSIRRLPVAGDIEGHDFLVLSGILGILASPARMASGQLSFTIERPETSAVEAPKDAAPATESDTVEPYDGIVVPESDVAPLVVTPPPTHSEAAYAW